MTAYYNENDPKAAAWLRELIKHGYIANGIVDERSIKDVQPNDLTDFTQCHFFAGIGGWSYALRLAEWPDDRPVWTGSCPCQPFSAAGKRGGTDDSRHLWPEFYRLIAECRPATVFGEQVASKDGLNWFDLVSADLESADYAVGAADLCAAGVGAPHIRQRLYFVADADSQRCSRLDSLLRKENDGRFAAPPVSETTGRGEAYKLADFQSQQHDGCRAARKGRRKLTDGCGENSEPAAQASFWGAHRNISCTDGKTRIGPIEPEFQPLADGVFGRVGLLRGYGNAIVPQVAAEFVRATMDSGYGC